FNAPRSLYSEGMFELNYGGLERFKGSPTAIVPDYHPVMEHGEFYRSLALLWAFREEFNKERQAYEKLLTLDPLAADAWMRLGQVSLNLRQPLRAEVALERAVALRPQDAEACRLLARLRWEQGVQEEAQRLYEQAAVAAPPADSLAAELGDFFISRKATRLAAEYYRSSLSQGGGSRPALILELGKALKELEAWHEAERIIGYGVSAFPSEMGMPLLMGETLLAQQRWQDALPWFQRALVINPKSAEAHYGLGRGAFGLDRREEAAKQFLRALRLDPYHVEASRLLQELRRSSTIEHTDNADSTKGHG
ncbi:MAG: tetratricopeptide repeat protein, partial [Acidimicrobiia bacterium]